MNIYVRFYILRIYKKYKAKKRREETKRKGRGKEREENHGRKRISNGKERNY